MSNDRLNTLIGANEFVDLVRVMNDPTFDIAIGLRAGMGIVHRFGRLPDVDVVDGDIAVWNGTKGSYLGFNATAGEKLSVSSDSAADVGSLVSSGTTTSASGTSFVDAAATFVADGVAIGDILINDTKGDHCMLTGVTETTLAGVVWAFGTTPEAGDAYRVVTPGGTGAAVARLHDLLDAAGAEFVEYVILNGITAVDTVGDDFIRCALATVPIAGSGGGNAGVITATQKVTVANVMFAMPAGDNATVICAYTVPAGKKAYLLQWGGSVIGASGADLTLHFHARRFREVFQELGEEPVRSAGSSIVARSYQLPRGPLRALTDIVVRAETDANNGAATAWFELLIVDD